MATKAKHQIRVRLRDKTTHESGTGSYRSAESRCRAETKKAGIGAIGTVYVYAKNKATGHESMTPVYEVRLVNGGDTGKPTLVPEDHTTPPPPPPEHHHA